MEIIFTVFLIFSLTFIILSLLVTSQVLNGGARIRQAAREVKQQHSLIDSNQSNNELINQIKTSNRAIEKEIVILTAREAKLKIKIFLLITNGILCLGLASRIFWINRNRKAQNAIGLPAESHNK